MRAFTDQTIMYFGEKIKWELSKLDFNILKHTIICISLREDYKTITKLTNNFT